MGWFRSPRWDEVDYLAIDLETTGTDPRRCAVLSIGTVPIRAGTIRWGEHWYQLVRPPDALRPATAAVKIHEIVPDELDAAPAIEEVLPEIARRIAGATLIVHYGRLDVGFLRRAFSKNHLRWPRPKVVDTLYLLGRLSYRRRLLDPSAEPLPADLARARTELDLPPHRHHHALYDALATAELMLALRARLGLMRWRQLR